MALKLKEWNEKDPNDKSYNIDGSRCKHLASQSNTDRSVEWDSHLKREDYKKLDGNPFTFFARTQWKGFGRNIDVVLIKDDDEIHLYEIL